MYAAGKVYDFTRFLHQELAKKILACTTFNNVEILALESSVLDL